MTVVTGIHMRFFGLAFVAFSLVACGGPSPTKTEPTGCVPGTSQACVCAPSVEGVQVCTQASVFDACQCGTLPDTGPGVDFGQPDMDVPPDDDMASCRPQSDADLCAADTSIACGTFTTTDRCGTSRTIDCGTCGGGEACLNNQCCGAETNAQLCSAQAAVCGTISTVDRCGMSRNPSCGTCAGSTPCDANNQCSCDANTAFFGQIGGNGLHDGGFPTTGSLSGNSGLSQVAAAMPLVDGTFVASDIAVNGATVVATSFDSRANETFWLQDGVTVGAVRLATPTIFVNVRVGDIVNFRATELQNFEGHPQISALQSFAIVSSNNPVPYLDRTGQAISISDYGKVVRIGGVLGSGVACGGASSCYPLTHGARVTTFRTASTFAEAGDCTTFVGPVGAFPGPLAPAPMAQIDAVNFSWAFTEF